MNFLDRLAESRICAARDAGELSNLIGSGQRIPEETDLLGVAPALRLAYRILKNAGYVPEELQLRREISEISALLSRCATDNETKTMNRKRLDLVLKRLDAIRGENLVLQEAYFMKVNRRLTQVQQSID